MSSPLPSSSSSEGRSAAASHGPSSNTNTPTPLSPPPAGDPSAANAGARSGTLIPSHGFAHAIAITSPRLQVLSYVLAELSSASTILPDYTRALINLSHRLLAAWQAVMAAAVAAHRRECELARFARHAARVRWRRRMRARECRRAFAAAAAAAGTGSHAGRPATQMQAECGGVSGGNERYATRGQIRESVPQLGFAAAWRSASLPDEHAQPARKSPRTERKYDVCDEVNEEEEKECRAEAGGTQAGGHAAAFADFGVQGEERSGCEEGGMGSRERAQYRKKQQRPHPQRSHRPHHHHHGHYHQHSDSHTSRESYRWSRCTGKKPCSLWMGEATTATSEITTSSDDDGERQRRHRETSAQPKNTAEERLAADYSRRCRPHPLPSRRSRGVVALTTSSSRRLRLAMMGARESEDAVARHVEAVRALTVAALYQHYLHVWVVESVNDLALLRWLRPASRAVVEREETSRITAAIAHAYGELARSQRQAREEATGTTGAPGGAVHSGGGGRGSVITPVHLATTTSTTTTTTTGVVKDESTPVGPRSGGNDGRGSTAVSQPTELPTVIMNPEDAEEAKRSPKHEQKCAWAGSAIHDCRFAFASVHRPDDRRNCGATHQQALSTPPSSHSHQRQQQQRRLGSLNRSTADIVLPTATNIHPPLPGVIPAFDASGELWRSPARPARGGLAPLSTATRPPAMSSSERFRQLTAKGKVSQDRFVELSNSDSDRERAKEKDNNLQEGEVEAGIGTALDAPSTVQNEGDRVIDGHTRHRHHCARAAAAAATRLPATAQCDHVDGSGSEDMVRMESPTGLVRAASPRARAQSARRPLRTQSSFAFTPLRHKPSLHPIHSGCQAASHFSEAGSDTVAAATIPSTAAATTATAVIDAHLKLGTGETNRGVAPIPLRAFMRCAVTLSPTVSAFGLMSRCVVRVVRMHRESDEEGPAGRGEAYRHFRSRMATTRGGNHRSEVDTPLPSPSLPVLPRETGGAQRAPEGRPESGDSDNISAAAESSKPGRGTDGRSPAIGEDDDEGRYYVVVVARRAVGGCHHVRPCFGNRKFIFALCSGPDAMVRGGGAPSCSTSVPMTAGGSEHDSSAHVDADVNHDREPLTGAVGAAQKMVEDDDEKPAQRGSLTGRKKQMLPPSGDSATGRDEEGGPCTKRERREGLHIERASPALGVYGTSSGPPPPQMAPPLVPPTLTASATPPPPLLEYPRVNPRRLASSISSSFSCSSSHGSTPGGAKGTRTPHSHPPSFPPLSSQSPPPTPPQSCSPLLAGRGDSGNSYNASLDPLQLTTAKGSPFANSFVACAEGEDGLVLTLPRRHTRVTRAATATAAANANTTTVATASNGSVMPSGGSGGGCGGRSREGGGSGHSTPSRVSDTGTRASSRRGTQATSACVSDADGYTRFLTQRTTFEETGGFDARSEGETRDKGEEQQDMDEEDRPERDFIVLHATQCSSTLRHARRWGDPYASGSDDGSEGDEEERRCGRLLLDRGTVLADEGITEPQRSVTNYTNMMCLVHGESGSGGGNGALVPAAGAAPLDIGHGRRVGTVGDASLPFLSSPQRFTPTGWRPHALSSFEQTVTLPPASGQDSVPSPARSRRVRHVKEKNDATPRGEAAEETIPSAAAAAAAAVIPSDGDFAYAQELHARLQFWCLRGQVRDAYVDPSHLKPRRRRLPPQPQLSEPIQQHDENQKDWRESDDEEGRHGDPPLPAEEEPGPPMPAYRGSPLPRRAGADLPTPIRLPLKLLNSDVGTIAFFVSHPSRGSGSCSSKDVSDASDSADDGKDACSARRARRQGHSTRFAAVRAAVNLHGQWLLREALLTSTEVVVVAARESRAHRGFHDRLHREAGLMERQGTLSDDEANPYAFDRHEHLGVHAEVHWLQGEQPPPPPPTAKAAGAENVVMPGVRLSADTYCGASSSLSASASFSVGAATAVTSSAPATTPSVVGLCDAAARATTVTAATATAPSPPPTMLHEGHRGAEAAGACTAGIKSTVRRGSHSGTQRRPLPAMEQRQTRAERLRGEFRLARSAQLDVLLVHTGHCKPIAALTLVPGSHHRLKRQRTGREGSESAELVWEAVRASDFEVSAFTHYIAPLWRHLREEKVLLVDMDRTLVDNAVTLPLALIRRRLSEAHRRHPPLLQPHGRRLSETQSSMVESREGAGSHHGNSTSPATGGEERMNASKAFTSTSSFTMTDTHTTRGLVYDGDETLLSFLATPLLPPSRPEALHYEARTPLRYPQRRANLAEEEHWSFPSTTMNGSTGYTAAAAGGTSRSTAVPPTTSTKTSTTATPATVPALRGVRDDPCDILCSEMLFIRPGLRQLLHRMAVQWGIPVLLTTKSTRERTRAAIAGGLDPNHLLFTDHHRQIITAEDLTRMTAKVALAEGSSGSAQHVPATGPRARDDALKDARMVLSHYDGLSGSDAAKLSSACGCHVGGGGASGDLRRRGRQQSGEPPACGPFSPIRPYPLSPTVAGHKKRSLFAPRQGLVRGIAIIDDSPQVWSAADWPATVPIAPYTLDRVDPIDYFSDNGFVASLALSGLFGSKCATCPYSSRSGGGDANSRAVRGRAGSMNKVSDSDGGERSIRNDASRPLPWPHCTCCCPASHFIQVLSQHTATTGTALSAGGVSKATAARTMDRQWYVSEVLSADASVSEDSSCCSKGRQPSVTSASSSASSSLFSQSSSRASVNSTCSSSSNLASMAGENASTLSSRSCSVVLPEKSSRRAPHRRTHRFAAHAAARIAAAVADPSYEVASVPATPSSLTVGRAPHSTGAHRSGGGRDTICGSTTTSTNTTNAAGARGSSAVRAALGSSVLEGEPELITGGVVVEEVSSDDAASLAGANDPNTQLRGEEEEGSADRVENVEPPQSRWEGSSACVNEGATRRECRARYVRVEAAEEIEDVVLPTSTATVGVSSAPRGRRESDGGFNSATGTATASPAAVVANTARRLEPSHEIEDVLPL